MGRHQRTLAQTLRFSGVGLHSGQRVSIQVKPAAVNSGIVFRTNHADMDSPMQQIEVAASIANIDERKSQLCTQLTHSRCSIGTVEHLMAALTAAWVTNAYVDIEILGATTLADNNTVELPILDGSSVLFTDAIRQAGVQTQDERVRFLKIMQPIQVLMEDKAAWLLPMPESLPASQTGYPTLHMTVQVNFEHKYLGTRHCQFTLGGPRQEKNLIDFHEHIAPARTFTFEEEIEWMRANGLALGGSLENAVVFAKTGNKLKENDGWSSNDRKGHRVLNPDGLRFPEDEWARHKLLDCIGDIGLAGIPLHGYFFATSPGHALTHKLLRELFHDPANYEEMHH